MDSKIAMSDLVKFFCQQEKLTIKEGDAFVRAFFETLERCLLQEKVVKVKDLGTFKVVDVADRESVDVNTGERIRIQGHGKITFTPDTELKDKVNRPFAACETIILSELTNLDDMTRLPEGVQDEEDDDEAGMEMTKVPEVPVVPETPESPEVPETPEIPEAPETPEIPETPETPEVPEIPETPEIPEIPEAPETPEIPEIPETPEQPSIPATPKKSEEKSEHVQWWYFLFFAFVLGMMLLSYFVGYYRLLCPCVVENTELIEKPVEKAKKDTAQAQPKDTLKVAPAAPAPKKAAAPAKEYAQVPGGKYTIVGTRGEHKMQVGDNLYKIARKEYGDRNMAQYIIVHNQFKNPDVIPLGYMVKLPELKANE